MKRLALTLAACFGALPLTAHAQPTWSPRVQVQGTELRVNDVLVLRTRSAVGGIAPAERTQLSAERLRELTVSGTGLEPREVRVDVETETRYRTETRTVTKMVEKTVTRRIRKKTPQSQSLCASSDKTNRPSSLHG